MGKYIKVDKRNKSQMKIHEKILSAVVAEIVEHPETTIISAINAAIDYHGRNTVETIMKPESFIEWVTTILNIRRNGGKWCLNRKREFAREILVKKVYKNVFGDEIEIVHEDNADTVAGQISVEELCPLESDSCPDITPEELEANEVEDSWSDTNPPEVITKEQIEADPYQDKSFDVPFYYLVKNAKRFSCENGVLTMTMEVDKWVSLF